MTNSKPAAAETDLKKLLENMSPVLSAEEYVFLSFPRTEYGDKAELQPIGSFVEKEGLTLVVPRESADEHGIKYQGVYKCVTLQVHSSLEAVGLTAAFSSQLTNRGISANVVAGYYHDHVFVSEPDAEDAMDALRKLSRKES